jgi:integrase
VTRHKRTRLATGIYKDRSGIAIVISVQGKPNEFRADAHGVTYANRDRAWLIRERVKRKSTAALEIDRTNAKGETFASDVERFLATLSPGHRRNTRGYMQHWQQAFTDRERNTITDVDAQTAFAAIHQAPSTKIHIRRALIQFYDTLNGKSGYNPGRAIKKPAKGEEPIRDLPWAWIERIFAALPPSRTKARLKLIAYVGLPHKQIGALQPSDLRLDRRELVVRPRRKGAGVSGRTQPLSDAAITALEEFAALDAFGTFQNRQLVETFRSGAKKAGVRLPDGARPYDLRHSFLTELARGGADIQEIAHLGMHATLEQANRYIKGAASERATNAITSIPRFRATKVSGKGRNRSTSVESRARKTAVKSRPKSR